MATFLRSIRHIRSFTTFARRSGLLSGKSQPVFDTREIPRCFSVRPSPTYNDSVSGGFTRIEKKLLKIDESMIRAGRVAYKEVWDLLQQFRNVGTIQSTQALMLIRCCGANMPSKTRECRAKLTQEVWETLQHLGVPMDISHYNALLRVNNENQVDYSPVEFLQDLLNKGLTPNRVTYQRLIACYCNKGDIEGAKQILEYMKEKELPLTEQIFNSLITGHANANDLDSAVETVELMKKSGITPSADTYVALMSAYAKFGKIDAINDILNDPKLSDFFLHQNYMEVIYALAINGQDEHVDMLLSKMPKGPGYNNDCIILIYRLINDNKVDIALKVYDSMWKKYDGDVVAQNSGFFFINQMVDSGKSLEEVLKVCKIMAHGRGMGSQLSVAISASHNIRDPNMIMSLLKEYRDAGEPIREHYFWPVLKVHADASNYNALLKTLKTMIEEFPPMPLLSTLTQYVVPYAIGSTQEKFQTLVDQGLDPLVVANSIVVDMLAGNRMREAAAFLEETNPAVYMKQVRSYLVGAMLKTMDVQSFTKILKTSQNAAEVSEEIAKLYEDYIQKDFVENTIINLLQNLPSSKQSVIPDLVDSLISMKVPISAKAADTIKNLWNKSNDTDLSDKLKKVAQPVDQQAVQRLESLLENNEDSDQPMLGVKVRLLQHYLDGGDFQNAATMAKELLDEKWSCSKHYGEYIVRMFSDAGIPDVAQKYYELVQQNDPKLGCSMRTSLTYAKMLIDLGRFDEAVDVIVKAAPQVGMTWRNALFSLMDTAVQRCEPEQIEKLAQVISEKAPNEVPRKVYGSIIEAHLHRDDLKAAIEKFEHYVKTMKITVAKIPLLKKLVLVEDANALQQVVNLISSTHGEFAAMHDLIFTFLECGRIRQARKILEMPNMILLPKQFQYYAQKFLEEGSRTKLERLIEITRGLNTLNRHEFYEILLSLHAKNNDWESALNMWTDIQDDNVATTNKFLITLADLLKRNNQPVPFVVPEEQEEELTLDKIDHQTLLEQIRTGTTPEEVSKIYKNLPNSQKTKQSVVHTVCTAFISMGKYSEAQSVLLNWLEKRPHFKVTILWSIFNSLATKGQTRVLEALQKHVPENFKVRVSPTRHIIASHIYRNNFEKFLDNCLAQPAEKFADPDMCSGLRQCTALILAEFDKNPSLVEKFENLAAMYKDGNFTSVGSILLLHYLSKDMDNKVTEMMETLLRHDSDSLKRCCYICSKNNFGDLFKKLQVKIENSSLPDDMKIHVNSMLVLYSMRNEEVDFAETLYNETMKKYHMVLPKVQEFVSNGGKWNKTPDAQQEEAPERVTEAAA